MKLLTELDSLDNVKDGETRKLITKTTSSGSGNAVTSVSVSGDTVTYTKGTSFATTAQLNNKQDTLVSGTNIKTINNESLLGSGNLEIGGEFSDAVDLTEGPIILEDFSFISDGEKTVEYGTLHWAPFSTIWNLLPENQGYVKLCVKKSSDSSYNGIFITRYRKQSDEIFFTPIIFSMPYWNLSEHSFRLIGAGIGSTEDATVDFVLFNCADIIATNKAFSYSSLTSTSLLNFEGEW